MARILAVVEIGSDPTTLLLIVGVFLATFILVAVAAYWLVRQSHPGPQGTTTWRLDVSQRLPVSRRTFDQLASVTDAALSRPQVTPETRRSLDRLAGARKTFVSFYRITMIAIGLFGVGVSVLWFREADSANMMGLPAAIVLLLSLGAILNGLIPSRTVDPIDPIDPALLDKIDVQVSTRPLTVELDESDLRRAADMRRHGSSSDEVARAVYPGYDGADEFTRKAVRTMLEQALKADRPQAP